MLAVMVAFTVFRNDLAQLLEDRPRVAGRTLRRLDRRGPLVAGRSRWRATEDTANGGATNLKREPARVCVVLDGSVGYTW